MHHLAYIDAVTMPSGNGYSRGMAKRSVVEVAVKVILPVTMACAGTSSPLAGVDAAGTVDAPVGKDVPFDTTDDAGETGPAGYFVTGELAGVTRLATYDIEAKPPGRTLIEAYLGPTKDTPYWSLNFNDPVGPFPLTGTCGNEIFYLQFIDNSVSPPDRFSSRAPTGSCTFTFAPPSSPDVFEGTFNAVLYLATKQMDFAVTEGRFRYPRWKEAGP